MVLSSDYPEERGEIEAKKLELEWIAMEFEEIEAPRHPNPDWVKVTMRAGSLTQAHRESNFLSFVHRKGNLKVHALVDGGNFLDGDGEGGAGRTEARDNESGQQLPSQHGRARWGCERYRAIRSSTAFQRETYASGSPACRYP